MLEGPAGGAFKPPRLVSIEPRREPNRPLVAFSGVHGSAAWSACKVRGAYPRTSCYSATTPGPLVPNGDSVCYKRCYKVQREALHFQSREHQTSDFEIRQPFHNHSSRQYGSNRCFATASSRFRTCILWQIFFTYVRTVSTLMFSLSPISL